MGEVLFYHLERGSLEGVLPGLLEKSLERGWRAVVRCGDDAAVARLDDLLWTYADDSFLPHGAGVGEEAAQQPVWLTTEMRNPNGAAVLFLVEGAEASPAEARGFERCVTIFDGHDEARLAAARAFWKAVKAEGVSATYWKQSDSGRWEKAG